MALYNCDLSIPIPGSCPSLQRSTTPCMASSISLHSLLKRAAPRLSRHFFEFKQCSRKDVCRPARSRLYSQASVRFPRQTPFLQAFRSQSTSSPVLSKPSTIDAIGEAARRVPRSPRWTLPAPSPAEKANYYPKTTRSIVAYWLLGSAASVFGLVVFGGLTRLTESG